MDANIFPGLISIYGHVDFLFCTISVQHYSPVMCLKEMLSKKPPCAASGEIPLRTIKLRCALIKM